MAPAAAYSSFNLASGPRSKLPSNGRKKSVTVLAKQQSPFGFGRRGAQSSADEEARAAASNKPNPFFIDFGKIPDPKSLVPAVVSTPSTSPFVIRRKDPGTVFVAGATGQAGIRITQALLRQGFAVRAGVADLASAQDLARLAATYKIISPAESKRLNAVESAFGGGAESIAKAIGPAAKVVVTIGPAENGPSGQVTTNDALEVVRAAQLAKVSHVAVVYDSGTSLASTYNVLDGITSFFSNLFFGKLPLTLPEFLEKVVETDVSYTVIKANLAHDYAVDSSKGLVVSKEGSAPGEEKVPKWQVASLVADVFSNTSVTENKVVLVSTSPSAPPKSIAELFSAIPEDGRRKAYAEALAKAKAEEEALTATEKAREVAEASEKLEKEIKKLSEKEARVASLAKAAQEKAEAAGSSLDGFLSKAKGFGADFSWEKLSSQVTAAVSPKSEEEEPKTQIATIRGQAKAQKLAPRKALVKGTPPKPKPNESETKTEVRKLFGGLFQQETIYVDE